MPNTLPWIADRRPARVRIIAPNGQPRVEQALAAMRPLFDQQFEVLRFDDEFADEQPDRDSDFAIVLGGDGTMMRAARQMSQSETPILGINLGKLGFLAGISPEDVDEAVADVVVGNCRVVEHLMLRCTVLRDGQQLASNLCVNEVAVLAGSTFSILDIDLYVDSELATTYSCDGLIISTPVGSTAHNLSAGGPILRKTLQACVISALSPHTLSVRPVVDSADRIYEMRARDGNESTSAVTDGQALCRLTTDDIVRVERAEAKFKLLEVAGQTYYGTLRQKLQWGGRIRHKKER